ncbi:ParB/RepB/Spo0J family partition protein [Methylococcus sp. EFPC2]|uniref:ParB/RepB/Spo0J family partition protein n=1 Tax=Methylococcus sp. EFPC2 TaxID=2812648 RepID=UPI001967642E|nr:ParB/RepB/Spo0J family partition protein [Methylococcus sp. EFPC2]QSA96086.1 ParB/RepB/Spo0J family partition protein [Methylococcus sp. EFPC2]
MSVKKRGLGRGLDALLGTTRTDVIGGSDKLRTLPVEFLKSGRFQPRKDFDPAGLQELADSISAQGVVQPIVVRASVDPDRYEIIAGERRWRAAQLAGLHEIPAVVREVTDQAALAIALIENIQREDLNPLEEAEALRRLLEEFSMTHQQVADAVGKSRATVTNLLRLNELNPDAKAYLQSGAIEMGHARAILGVAYDKQGEIAGKVAEKQLTVRETESLIRKLNEAPGEAQLVPRQDPDIERLVERMTQTLGVRVEIKHGKKGVGKLIINYDNLDQLDGVLKRLE